MLLCWAATHLQVGAFLNKWVMLYCKLNQCHIPYTGLLSYSNVHQWELLSQWIAAQHRFIFTRHCCSDQSDKRKLIRGMTACVVVFSFLLLQRHRSTQEEPQTSTFRLQFWSWSRMQPYLALLLGFVASAASGKAQRDTDCLSYCDFHCSTFCFELKATVIINV